MGEEAIGDSEFNNVGSQVGEQVANRRRRSGTYTSIVTQIEGLLDSLSNAPPIYIANGAQFGVGPIFLNSTAKAKQPNPPNRQGRSLDGEEVEEVEDDSEFINLDSQIVEEI